MKKIIEKIKDRWSEFLQDANGSKRAKGAGKKDKSQSLLGGKEGSWRNLTEIYKTVKIPWHFLILVMLSSIGTQWVSVRIVEYTSKIDTGTMTGGTFMVGYVTFAVLSFIFEYAYDLMGSLGNARMSKNVRTRLWGRMLRMPVSAYEKEEPQRLVSRVTKDATFAYSALSALIQIISVVYGIVIAIIPVVRIFGAYSWIIAVVIPVLVVCSYIVGKIEYRIERMINRVYSRMTNFYSERLPNITYIKTNNMEKAEYKKGVKASNEKYRADIIYKALYALQLPLQSLANYIGLVFVLITASAMVRGGTMTALELKQLMLYFEVVMEDVTLILGIWMALKVAHGGSEKIADINAAPAEDLSGDITDFAGEDIVFENVSFGYTQEKNVLKEASFTIPKGKVTAIVGENGSGKSTVTRLLERFDVPKEGRIMVGSHPLEDIDGKTWRKSLGYVFQGNQMIEGTIRENIAYGANEGYSEEELINAARLSESYDFINEKEEGFDTPVHVFESELSGGQLQRLAIARAFMKDADYLIMDEATSGVDVIKEKAIMEAARKKMKDKTLVFISHNMETAKGADYIVVLNDGRVEAQGSPDEVYKASETYRALVG